MSPWIRSHDMTPAGPLSLDIVDIGEMKISDSPWMHGTFWMTCSAMLFSLMSVLVRVASDEQGVNSWLTAEVRFAVCIAVVYIISFWQHDPLRFVNRRWLISRGLFGGLSASIYFYSITKIGISKATIFTYTYPLWAALLAPLLLKERIIPGVWAAVGVSFGGLYLIIVPPEGLGAISWLDLLAITGGLFAGWAILSIKKLHETDTSRAIIFSQSFFGLFIVAVPSHSYGYALALPAWITLIAVGLVAAAAQLQMTHAYRFIGATEGSLLSMLTPVMNVILGLLIFQEPVTTRSLVGCFIVLTGCTYAAIPQKIPEGGLGS